MKPYELRSFLIALLWFALAVTSVRWAVGRVWGKIERTNRMATRIELNNETKLKIVKYYSEGVSLRKTSQHFGFCIQVITRIVNEAGAMHKPLTDAQKQSIVTEYNTGLSCKEIAERYKANPSWVSHILRTNGAKIRANKTVPSADKKGIVDRYAGGESSYVIAKEFGVCVQTVLDYVKMAGIEVRAQKSIIGSRKPEILTLYASGLSISQVAKEIGVTKQPIFKILKSEDATRTKQQANAMLWANQEFRSIVSKASSETTKKRKGKNNPNWQGGKTALSKSVRNSDKYLEWRKAVFIRDRFACQWCGKRNGKKRVIEADHIYPFSALLHDNGIKTREQAMECEALWDIKNGRTLCKSCHEKTDTYQNGARKYIKK